MNRKTARKLKRGVVVTLLFVAAFFGLVEVLAWTNIRSERRKRAYLGDELFRRVEGKGPPIVFIAGLQGSTRYWGNKLQSLRTSRRLIYVDLYGFGQSPWPLKEPELEDHLAWLRRTLVAEGATREVTLVAHSFGAIVAAEYAARYPGEMRDVYLLGAPVFRNESEARERIHDMSELAAAFSLNPLLAREACLTMGAFRPLFRRILPKFARKGSPEVLEDAVLHDWPSINGAIQNVLLTKPIATPVMKLGQLVTFVHGTRDRVTPLPRIRELAAATAAKVVVLPVDHQGYVSSGGAPWIELLNSPQLKAVSQAVLPRRYGGERVVMRDSQHEPLREGRSAMTPSA